MTPNLRFQPKLKSTTAFGPPPIAIRPITEQQGCHGDIPAAPPKTPPTPPRGGGLWEVPQAARRVHAGRRESALS